MAGLDRSILRSGAWLTRERVRLVALALLAASLLGASSSWSPPRTASTTASAGRSAPISPTSMPPAPMCSRATPPRPSIRHSNTRASRRSSARTRQFYGWHYPPFFLGLAALLALMPYALALALWQGVTLRCFICWVDRGAILHHGTRARDRSKRRPAMAVRSPSPSRPCSLISATAITASSPPHCSAPRCCNSTAGPLLAGVLFGLLAYKPQFGLLDPAGARGKRTLARLCRRGGDRRRC